MIPYYEHGGQVIYHGDCREILPELPDGMAQIFLSDLPYGLAYTTDAKKGLRGDAQRQGIRQLRSVLLDCDRLLARPAAIYLFCHWESWPDFYDAVASYWDVKNALIWHKAAGGSGDCLADYAHDYEMVLYALKGRRPLIGSRDGSVLRRMPVTNQERQHPTEKPVDVLAYYLGKSAAPGDCVLDPFMGVGSTLVACKAHGCRAIGIEIEERYCEIAARRLAQEVLPLASGSEEGRQR